MGVKARKKRRNATAPSACDRKLLRPRCMRVRLADYTFLFETPTALRSIEACFRLAAARTSDRQTHRHVADCCLSARGNVLRDLDLVAGRPAV
eukprot:6174320-Pleurochrysis_carterae.AAC.2